MGEFINIGDKEFYIANKVEFKKNNYLYVINTDESGEFSILLETQIDDEKYFKSIKDEKLIKEILSIIMKN